MEPQSEFIGAFLSLFDVSRMIELESEICAKTCARIDVVIPCLLYFAGDDGDKAENDDSELDEDVEQEDVLELLEFLRIFIYSKS